MRTIAVAALAAAFAALPACGSTKTCTLVGCDSAITVAYWHPVAGAYTLSLETAGLKVDSVSCPVASSVVPGNALLQCDANGFTLSSATAFGSSAPGTDPIVISATLTPASGAATSASISATIASKSQPNGPTCDPTCYAYTGAAF
jgi:hypothetical protein